MGAGTEKLVVPEVPLTAVITEAQWAEIMPLDVVGQRLGKRNNAQEAKEYVALLVECGYDTLAVLRTAVARELHGELGIP